MLSLTPQQTPEACFEAAHRIVSDGCGKGVITALLRAAPAAKPDVPWSEILRIADEADHMGLFKFAIDVRIGMMASFERIDES